MFLKLWVKSYGHQFLRFIKFRFLSFKKYEQGAPRTAGPNGTPLARYVFGGILRLLNKFNGVSLIPIIQDIPTYLLFCTVLKKNHDQLKIARKKGGGWISMRGFQSVPTSHAYSWGCIINKPFS